MSKSSSDNDVIRASLRLLEEKEKRIQHLCNETQKVLDSGVSEGFDINQFLTNLNKEFKKQ